MREIVTLNSRSSSRAISVLVATPSLRGGGSERVVTTLLRHFDPMCVDVMLAVVDGREAALAPDLPSSLRWVDLACNRVLRAVPLLCRLIWHMRPHVVLTTLSHMNLMLAIVKPLLPRSTRLVARESSVLSEVIRSERHPVLWKWAYRRYYPRLDHIVCQSRVMQDDLCKQFGVSRHKTSLIPNPVDLEVIARQSADVAESSHRRSDAVRFVAVGRLVPVKGFDILLQAMYLIDAPQVQLDLLGDGPELPRLRALADSLGLLSRVHFCGFQSNPYRWMRGADALILSSRYEGLPNVVIEALACGTPVVSTPVPAVLDILTGVDQCVVARGMSSDDLAQAMHQWLTSSRERVPQHHISRFEAKAVTRQYEETLNYVATTI